MAKEQNTNFEAQLFKAADKLRKNIDAAEYKNVALGLIFLKYISESFQELYDKLAQDEFSDPEDRDEYKAENIFFVPEQARWKNLQAKAKLPTIGQELDDAMESIEKENPELRNVLPKVFGKPNLDKTSLGQLIDLISNTELKATSENSKDLFGRVYEYFLGEFANAEGKKGGQFYTPKSIVKLMVEMIEPYKGRVYDPACGSGGMFVMSEKFVSEHQGNIKDITIYGQESNQTTWKLSKMNLAIRNINSQFVAWNTEGSFLKDAHPDLKADYILANPPFNQSDWGQEILQDDARWKYGVPSKTNANFAWLQHMIYHLSTDGKAAIVLGNGSLVSDEQSDSEIRKNLLENDLVESIVLLPSDIFYNTDIPACIWFINRNKNKTKNKVLFIDIRHKYERINRKHVTIGDNQILQISKTFKSFKEDNGYQDIKGYCKSVSLETIREHQYFVSPGRFVEVLDIEKNKNIDEELNILVKSIKEYPVNKLLDKKINSTANEYGKILFEKYFLKFEGKLKESEIGEIPENWNVVSVGDLVEEVSEKNKNNFDLQVYSVTKNHMFVASDEYFNKQVYSSDLKNYKIINELEFGYNPARINIGSIGFFNLDEAGLVSPAYTVFKAKNGYSPYFVWYLLNSYRIFELIKNFCVGTVRQVFRFNDFSYIKFAMPPKEVIDQFENELLEIIKIKKDKELETLNDFSKVIEKKKNYNFME